MSILEPNESYFAHYGTKGMKWGIRKKIYSRQKEFAKRDRTDAKTLRKGAGEIESGKSKPDANLVKSVKRQADALEGLDTKTSREMRQIAKDIESGKSLNKRQKQTLRKVADEAEIESKDWESRARNTKAKMDKLKREMDKPITSDSEERKEKRKAGAKKVAIALAGFAALGAVTYVTSSEASKASGPRPNKYLRPGSITDEQFQAGMDKLFRG